jgi:hypothetical protein
MESPEVEENESDTLSCQVEEHADENRDFFHKIK